MSKVSFKHWQQAKEIFEAALERSGADREDFVAKSCGDDPVLRNEVNSLLHSYDDAGSFMESPAIAPMAESLLAEKAQLTAGQQINHYEVIEPIGEGGMGEVYLARDTNLGRRVALKLLPEYVSRDPERLRRFKHEARLASTLSHPNVCVIHEIGETGNGQPFIAMEYIEGATLRQHLENNTVNVGEALNIGVQVADALNAAHEAGIIHRDIKPENIMLRRDGYVKVLDFGLAKLTESPSRGVSHTKSTLLLHSAPGTVMGTVAYMSPEQARGVSVDRRTDVWSLGVVLYEMLCGRAPFVGETPTDVIIAIVDKEPPAITQFTEDVPSELERIVRKALRKDPEQRYQIIKELGIDLRGLQRDLDVDRSLAPALATGQVTPTDHRNRKLLLNTAELKTSRKTLRGFPAAGESWSSRQLVIGLVAAVIVTIAGFGILKWIRNSELSPPLPLRYERINVTKLTTNGNANFASISPDGKYVGYVKSEGGKQSLWLRQVGSAGNLEIIPPREGYYQGLAFSPDGNYIYYGYTTDPAVSEVFKVPTLSVGAIGVKVKPTEGPSNMSHDGKHNALVRFDREHQQDLLIVTNADGSNEQVMTARKWPARLAWDWGTTAAWSSDDKKLVLPVMNSDAQGVYVTMLEVNVADHSERIIPMSPQRFEQPSDITVLKDTRGIILSGKAQGASFSQIWYLGLDGSARPLTNDLSDYLAAVLTEDSTSLVTVQRQTLGNIWTSTKNDSAKPIQVTSGLGRYFDITWSPDNKIVYASDASGIADIYEVNADGSGVKQLTSGMKRNYSPTVSPDNRYIAFHSNRSGIFQIWRMDRDGSSPVQLTTGDTESNWPQFSPDGKYIYYEHFEAGRTGTTWRVAVENGTPERVNDGYTLRPTISPDGKWLAYWYNEGQETSRWRLQITSLDGSQQVRTFDLAKSVAVQWDTMLHWSSDSRSLTFVDRRGGVDNIWAQPIDGGPTRQVTKFSDSQIFAFDWYKDGTLAASRGVITSDVVLISEVTTR